MVSVSVPSSLTSVSCGVQKLEPSNVKPFDCFGASVSIDGDAIIVGSHQDFEEGNLVYQRAVQVSLCITAGLIFIWRETAGVCSLIYGKPRVLIVGGDQYVKISNVHT